MSPKILVLDIETQRAIVETFSLFKPWIGIDRVVAPSRILCFAAKWHDSDKAIFHAAWDDGDAAGYEKMLKAAWDLFNEADFIVTWNGDRFDLQWFESEFLLAGLGRPSPYRSLDLIKVAKKHFKAGLMSLKLDWSARLLLRDRKVGHGGSDLWHDIRYGNRAAKRAAQKLMREYNIHDTRLTDQILDKYLPWIGANFALYDEDEGADREPTCCIKCGSAETTKQGFAYTTAYKYQRYLCKSCGSWSRGKRMVYTTDLRPV